MNYPEQAFRNYVRADDLVRFEIIEKETDLLILAEKNLYDKALASTLGHRAELEKYIAADPRFQKALSPCRVRGGAPPIVREMAAAAQKTKVGPMASVAGAVAELVGRDLAAYSEELIIENGKNIFLKTNRPRRVAIHPGITLELDPLPAPFSVCSSSGAGPSNFSFGKADLVTVIALNAALADAAATAIGNVIKDETDIEQGLKLAGKIKNLNGVLIIKGEQLGARGKIKLVPA